MKFNINAAPLAVLAVTAVAVSGEQHSRRLAKRFLDEHEDLALAFDMSADWTCVMSGAESETSCEAMKSCAWCPLGSQFGFCVSTDQGAAINDVDIPHMTCGAEVSAEDTKFWDDLVGCEMASITEEGCLRQPFGCTWCTLEEPEFGLCVSEEFMTTFEELQDPEEPMKIEDFVKCSTSNRDTGVEGLLDFSCVMLMAEDEEVCTSMSDASGLACVYEDTEEFGPLCLTPTQSNLFHWVFGMLDQFGITMDDITSEISIITDNTRVEATEEWEQEYVQVQEEAPASEEWESAENEKDYDEEESGDEEIYSTYYSEEEGSEDEEEYVSETEEMFGGEDEYFIAESANKDLLIEEGAGVATTKEQHEPLVHINSLRASQHNGD